MESKKGIVKLSRKQLYNDIWEMSVAGVARKYNLNYARLIEACRTSDIPFPSSGYWTRRNCGKDVSSEIILLSGDEDEIVELLTNDSVVKGLRKNIIASNMPVEQGNEDKSPNMIDTYDDSATQSQVLSFLSNEERIKVLAVACNLKIEGNNRLHKVLSQYKKRIADYNEQLKNAQSQRYYNPRYNKPADEPSFFGEVSADGTKRIMVILDALYKAIEKLGGTVNEDLSIKLNDDIVRLRVAESKDKIRHELTKQEAQALLKYQDELKRHSWASKPQIRQYDHVFNGRLRIVFGEKSYIRDSEKEKLEDRLGDILITIYEKAEENRIIRVRHEEEQRRREAEARRQEEIRKRKEEQIRLTKELANKAEDYRIASEIRAYITAMIEKGDESVTQQWIEWAKEKADWYDPTIAREDEYLGKRDHGKNKDEKDLTEKQVNRNWYW